MKQKIFKPPAYTLLDLLLKSHYYICRWKLLPNKSTEKSGKQRALQMPGASELCGLEERFVGLRSWGLACELSVHMDALNPFLSVSVMFGNK